MSVRYLAPAENVREMIDVRTFRDKDPIECR